MKGRKELSLCLNLNLILSLATLKLFPTRSSTIQVSLSSLLHSQLPLDLLPELPLELGCVLFFDLFTHLRKHLLRLEEDFAVGVDFLFLLRSVIISMDLDLNGKLGACTRESLFSVGPEQDSSWVDIIGRLRSLIWKVSAIGLLRWLQLCLIFSYVFVAVRQKVIDLERREAIPSYSLFSAFVLDDYSRSPRERSSDPNGPTYTLGICCTLSM